MPTDKDSVITGISDWVVGPGFGDSVNNEFTGTNSLYLKYLQHIVESESNREKIQGFADLYGRAKELSLRHHTANKTVILYEEKASGKVYADVPIVIVDEDVRGQAKKKFSLLVSSVVLRCLREDIPDVIELDVTYISPKKESLYLNELPLPENIEIAPAYQLIAPSCLMASRSENLTQYRDFTASDRWDSMASLANASLAGANIATGSLYNTRQLFKKEVKDPWESTVTVDLSDLPAEAELLLSDRSDHDGLPSMLVTSNEKHISHQSGMGSLTVTPELQEEFDRSMESCLEEESDDVHDYVFNPRLTIRNPYPL